MFLSLHPLHNGSVDILRPVGQPCGEAAGHRCSVQDTQSHCRLTLVKQHSAYIYIYIYNYILLRSTRGRFIYMWVQRNPLAIDRYIVLVLNVNHSLIWSTVGPQWSTVSTVSGSQSVVHSQWSTVSGPQSAPWSPLHSVQHILGHITYRPRYIMVI